MEYGDSNSWTSSALPRTLLSTRSYISACSGIRNLSRSIDTKKRREHCDQPLNYSSTPVVQISPTSSTLLEKTSFQPTTPLATVPLNPTSSRMTATTTPLFNTSTSIMAAQHPASSDPKRSNLVHWTFSGTYDADRPVLIDASNPDRFITKNMALKLVASLQGAFHENSTVCLHLANDITYPILCLAIWASKCRWTGTNQVYTAPELQHHFRISKTKYVVTTEDKLETVQSAVAASGTNAEIILFSDILLKKNCSMAGAPPYCASPTTDEEQGLRNLHDLLGPGTPDIMFQASKDIDVQSLATLCPTSGTTGPPKMAAHTHRATVIESFATADNHHAKPYAVRRLFSTPIFHSFSTPEMVINSLRLGIPSYFMQRFDGDLFPKAIHDFEITETFAPPPMLLRLINNPAAHSQIRTLRNIYSGGAPLAAELRAKFNALYPGEPPRITQVWGMTEGGWFTSNKYDEVDETNSCGRPIPGYEAKITKNHTTKANGHTAGEVYVRGPALMKCYFGNAAATAEAFDGEWLRTGDIGYMVDGKVYLVDRCKDLIKVNGWQVAPSELEDALLVSASVKDCGVVAAGHGLAEHPLAFVVRAHEHVTAEKLKKHMRQRLASYKCSTMEFRFVGEIPKSVSGKILKKELKRMAEE